MAREFIYKGKTLEELKALSHDEFADLIPTSLRRSLKRSGHSKKRFLEKLRNHDKAKPFRTHTREMVILPEMVGMNFAVYCGKDWSKFEVQPEMIGHRLGEYAHTCKQVKHSGPGIGATRGSKSVELK